MVTLRQDVGQRVSVLRIGRGLGLVTLFEVVNAHEKLLRIGRGLGLVTLARFRMLPRVCCGLVAGWDWLPCRPRRP